MPIVNVNDQTYHPQGDPTLITMNKRGGTRSKVPATPGSKTQLRKANLASHRAGAKPR